MTRFWPTPNSDETGTGRKDGEPAGPTTEAAGELDVGAGPVELQAAVTIVTDRRHAAATVADRGMGRCMAVAYGRSLTPAF